VYDPDGAIVEIIRDSPHETELTKEIKQKTIEREHIKETKQRVEQKANSVVGKTNREGKTKSHMKRNPPPSSTCSKRSKHENVQQAVAVVEIEEDVTGEFMDVQDDADDLLEQEGFIEDEDPKPCVRDRLTEFNCCNPRI
jgi:hypothetical protein